MLPGADVYFDMYGTSADIYPSDVYVMYTLRVDVLKKWIKKICN